MTTVTDTMAYTPKQREFMYSALEEPDVTDLYFAGGVRSGKSVSVAKAGWHTAMRYPESHGLYTRSTLKELKTATLQSTVFGKDKDGEWVIPPDTIEKHDKELQEIIFKNGSKWSYFGMDQIERFLGMEFSYWMAEEANRYKKRVFDYVRNTRICHRVGPHKAFYNSNTDTGQDHLYNRFFEEKRPGHKAVVVTTLENVKNLPEKFVAYLKELKIRDPQAYNVYVMAQFQGMAGLAYPQFNPLYHMVDPFDIPREWPLVRGLDHGFSHYTLALELRVDAEGNVWITSEYAEKGRAIPENAEALKKKNWIHFHVVDPSLWKQKTNSSTGKRTMVTIARDYEDHGISMVAGDNSMAGIERLRSYLYVDMNKIHPMLQATGCPKMFFLRGRCPVTVRQLSNLRVKENRDGDATEELCDGDDDGPDLLRYFVNSDLTPIIRGFKEELRQPWETPPWERARAGRLGYQEGSIPGFPPGM